LRPIDLPVRLAYLPAQSRSHPVDRSRRREAHLPAQQARPQAPAWLSSAHGDCCRAPGIGGAPREGSQTAVSLSHIGERRAATAAIRAGKLAILKSRAEFLRVAASRQKAVTPGLILQAASRPVGDRTGAARVGFTASRKVGNAVLRNRAKRRLRAAAAQILAREARPLTDYVLIARQATARRPFAALLGDLETALRRLGHDADGSVRRRSPEE
jgi:ribonuclease P protein component